MDLLIIIIVIAAVLSSGNKKKKKKQTTVAQVNKNARERQRQQTKQMQNGWNEQSQKQTKAKNHNSNQQIQDIQKQRELKRRLEEKYNKKPAAQTGTILDRAIGNVHEDSVDEMKMRDAHQHTNAGGNMQNKTPEELMTEGNVLMDKVYDLMVTGYSSNMQFERDFLAEGMDMLNRIQS